MKHRLLIIDDEPMQVGNFKRFIQPIRPDLSVDSASTKDEILLKISSTYFDVAIVDLRMTSIDLSGFDVIRDIIDINPLAKVIVVSAFLAEFTSEINSIIKTGRIAAFIDKTKFDTFSKLLLHEVDKIIEDHEKDQSLIQRTLESIYSEAKNEVDPILKGKRFENFTAVLFSQMGFNHILNRVRDKSMNEVDLVVRNDINDTFFQKFKPYFLVECKNTMNDVDKNTFITFLSKLENTNGLSNLGFIITSSGFKKTAYAEAMRSSKGGSKIVFLSNIEISELIKSNDLLDTIKKIIDDQVKDN